LITYEITNLERR